MKRAVVGATTLLALMAALVGCPEPAPAQGSGSAPVAASQAAEVQQAQAAVVRADHSGPIASAQESVTSDQYAVAADAAAVSAADAAASSSASDAAAAAHSDAAAHQALDAAQGVLASDNAALALDRRRLGALALLMYTGEPASLMPSTLLGLETGQQAVLQLGQLESLASVVDRHVHQDLGAQRIAAATERSATNTARRADATMDADEASAGRDASLDALARTTLAAASNRLSADRTALVSAEAALQADLTAEVGAPAGAVSIVGRSVLTAEQLAGWYSYEGYADLTSAPISELASWYVDAGEQLGVRGDVAFAQAVLETGGFSSPDAVDLSNFAGIGHCDTCAAGWAFPSPQQGVVGQEQLLEIFADAAGFPPGAPPPVLPALTPAKQFERGCCATWESLTGVWATDPSYGYQILDIYQQMLQWAGSSGRVQSAAMPGG